jgi:single-strand DNA-binding protein
MLPMINGVATLGKDIELTYLPDGTGIAKMSLAFSDKVKKKGEWVDETLWLNGTLFGKQAEYIAGNATKGDFIEVRGTLRSNDWVDKDGKKHYDTSLMIDSVKLLTKKPQSAPKPQQKPKAQEVFEDDPNCIPF